MSREFIARDQLAEGCFVRIDGVPCEVTKVHNDGKREFLDVVNLKAFPLTKAALYKMHLENRIVTDLQWQSLDPHVKKILEVDWNAFTDEQRTIAEWRALFCRELDKDPQNRRVAKVVQEAIDRVHAENPKYKKPSVQTVKRSWDKFWVLSGKKIKALIPQFQNRGNRRDNDPCNWADDRCLEIIEEYRTGRLEHVLSVGQLQTYASDTILDEALDEDDPKPLRPGLLRINGIGFNRIRTLINGKLTQQQRSVHTVGAREARRQASGIARGPSGTGPLVEVECDHTELDVLVLDENGKKRRAHITALIDRFSGIIVGIHISFRKPNWETLIHALHEAVNPKEDLLKRLGYEFIQPWPVSGTMDYLYVDRAQEFQSQTADTIMSAIGVQPRALPKASGYLKGKIEKWLGDHGRQHLSRLSGYVGANPSERDLDRAMAKLSLDALARLTYIWIIEVHNRKRDPETRQIRMKTFEDAMNSGDDYKFPPDNDLFGPGLSPACTAWIRNGQIRIYGVSYASAALVEMGKNGPVQVLVRPVLEDADRLIIHGPDYFYTEARLEGRWAGLGLTHEGLIARRAKDREIKETDEELAKDRKARQNYHAEVENVNGKARRRKSDLTKTPKKRSETLSEGPYDPDASGAGLVSHNEREKIAVERYDSRGPWKTPTTAERAVEADLTEVARLRAAEGVQASDMPPHPANPQFTRNTLTPKEKLSRLAGQSSRPARASAVVSGLPNLFDDGSFKL